MAIVLLDNATISSAFRALGLIPIPDSDLLDIEQTALERLTESILLAERVIIPDNYISEHKSQRKKILSDECFEHAEIGSIEDQALNLISNELSKVWFDAFQAGTNRGTFTHYFDQANAFATFVWENTSSVFYLVFRALGIDKTNPLINAFLASPADYGRGREVRVLDRSGEPVEWKSLASHVKKMVSVLAWLGNEYVWHQVLAAQRDVIYLPHPLREFFAYDFMDRLRPSSNSAQEFAKAFHAGMNSFRQKMGTLFEKLDLLSSADSLRIPNFLPLVLSQASSGDDFLQTAYQLRRESNVAELRGVFSKIEINLSQGNLKPHKRLIRDLEQIGTAVLKQHGIQSSYIKLSPPLSILGISISGDDAGIELPIPSLLYKQYFLHRRYRVFLRSVMEELAVIPTLNGYKDQINGFAKIEGDKYPPFYLRKIRMSYYYKPFNSKDPNV